MPTSPSVVLDLKGTKQMQGRIRNLTRKIPDAAGTALYLEAEHILRDSKDNYVPVDEGTLRDFGHVTKPERSGLDITLKIVYGGAASPYALAIHEHPSKYSPPSWQGKEINFSPQGRGPKYLEKPFNEALPGMSARLAKRISDSLE